jgi:hypothetical protein
MSYSKPFTITNRLAQYLGTPYLHTEGTTELVACTYTQLPVSRWIPAHASSLLPLLEGVTGFLALPVYLNKSAHGSSIADFQLAVTGSIAGFETPDESSVREIQEEIGFQTSPASIIRATTFEFKGKEINVSLHCPATLTMAVTPPTPAGRDNKQRKVITWILMNRPEDIFTRKRIASSDTAGEVVVVAAVSDVRRLLSEFF